MARHQAARAVQLGNYFFSLPAGYYEATSSQLMENMRKLGAVGAIYGGSRHSDGTPPVMGITVTTIHRFVPPVLEARARQEAVQGVLKRLARIGTITTQGAAQDVNISGLVFRKMHFTQIMPTPTGTKTLHGIQYASVKGRIFISIQLLDAAPFSYQTFPIMEAAVSTFHHH